MDQESSRMPEEMKALQDEAIRRALEISELEEKDHFSFSLFLSFLFLSPGMDKAVDTRARKLTRIEHFRQWLKENKLTPRDVGIGSDFVKRYLPEYSFLY